MFVAKRGGTCLNADISWEMMSKRGQMKVRRKNSPKRLIA
jgi:hypothetical protein